MAQRLRQSSAAFEEAFAEQMEEERRRAEELRRRALQRTQQRRRERVHRSGTVRFLTLVLMLIATAVLVTIGMFQLLFLVMG
ncbi:MAG TPA: hypothetical protein VLA98_10755 [Solirubrobacteraceae bacterium]|nr:hypothetical protein [Solirubrobacteraceae bacterium]